MKETINSGIDYYQDLANRVINANQETFVAYWRKDNPTERMEDWELTYQVDITYRDMVFFGMRKKPE